MLLTSITLNAITIVTWYNVMAAAVVIAVFGVSYQWSAFRLSIRGTHSAILFVCVSMATIFIFITHWLSSSMTRGKPDHSLASGYSVILY